jgi:capsular polysaccharide transport system ATP-binding protein
MNAGTRRLARNEHPRAGAGLDHGVRGMRGCSVRKARGTDVACSQIIEKVHGASLHPAVALAMDRDRLCESLAGRGLDSGIPRQDADPSCASAEFFQLWRKQSTQSPFRHRFPASFGEYAPNSMQIFIKSPNWFINVNAMLLWQKRRDRRPEKIGKMLEFDSVSKSFWTGTQRKVILDRASFRVEVGRSVGILAPNGTGKTTIINMMAGLEKPDEGRVTRACRVSFPLGYIARLYGLDPDYVEAFCRYLCGIEEYFDMPIGTYSQGMRARFTFSLMLSLEFDIYLIDEGMPTTTDVEFNRKAGSILKERLQNATVVVVSHQPKTLERFAQSALVLRDGQMYQFDTLDEAKRLYDYETQS